MICLEGQSDRHTVTPVAIVVSAVVAVVSVVAAAVVIVIETVGVRNDLKVIADLIPLVLQGTVAARRSG